jgi:hypothetical protein
MSDRMRKHNYGPVSVEHLPQTYLPSISERSSARSGILVTVSCAGFTPSVPAKPDLIASPLSLDKTSCISTRCERIDQCIAVTSRIRRPRSAAGRQMIRGVRGDGRAGH